MSLARLGRTRRLAAAGALAAALSGVLVLASQLGAATGTPRPPARAAQAGEVRALLAGIPQRGSVLGSVDAPVTLVEYADLQCPYCGEFARGALPALVREYVRTGKVRLVFRGLAFVGPDSRVALEAVEAAALQNRLFHVLELLYASQGVENTGWVTDSLLRRIGASVPGLEGARMLRDRGSAPVAAAMAAAARAAAADAVTGTPTFLVGPTGGRLAPLPVTSLAPEAFRPALDALLAA
jgi:protein-disulfide isomerase